MRSILSRRHWLRSSAILGGGLLSAPLAGWAADDAPGPLPKRIAAWAEDDAIRDLAFSPDDTLLAVTCGMHAKRKFRPGKVVIREVPSGARRAGFEVARALATGGTFSPDGKSLAVGDWDRVLIWDVETRQMRRPPARPHWRKADSRIRSLAFDRAGEKLFAITDRGEVRFWDLETLDWLDLKELPERLSVLAAGFDPFGTPLRLVQQDHWAEPFKARDPRPKGPPFGVPGRYDIVLQEALSGGDRWVCTSPFLSQDALISPTGLVAARVGSTRPSPPPVRPDNVEYAFLLNGPAGHEVKIPFPKRGFSCKVFNSDGSILATATPGPPGPLEPFTPGPPGSVAVDFWEAATGLNVDHFPVNFDYIGHLALGHHGDLLAMSYGLSVEVWRLKAPVSRPKG